MKILFLASVLLLTLAASSQTLQYDITANNSSIGTLSVTKKEDKGIIQIEAISHVKVKLFITIDFSYKLNCTFKEHQLIFSSVTTYVNGKIHSSTKTEKIGEFYTITKDGHSSKYMNTINFTGGLLYFEKPQNNQYLYSELDGITKPIQKIDNNNYEIINPVNGHLNYYYYKNDILESTTIQHRLLTFKLTKI